MNKVVSADSLNDIDLRCPECKGSDFVLEGFAQKRYAVEYLHGKISGEVYADEPWQHDVKLIRCLNTKCQVVTEVISPQLWQALQTASTVIKPC